jgi:hypothetical protein
MGDELPIVGGASAGAASDDAAAADEDSDSSVGPLPSEDWDTHPTSTAMASKAINTSTSGERDRASRF